MERGRRHASDLEAARRALATWRREHGGAGRRIPANLWAAAADVARIEGVEATARALRLNAAKLAALSVETPGGSGADMPAPSAAVRFVEIDGLELRAPTSAVVIRLLGQDGEQVRVDVPRGGSNEVIIELARAFWGRSP